MNTNYIDEATGLEISMAYFSEIEGAWKLYKTLDAVKIAMKNHQSTVYTNYSDIDTPFFTFKDFLKRINDDKKAYGIYFDLLKNA